MSNSVKGKVTESLQAAEELYHQLVLLVGASGSGKTAILQAVAINADVLVNNLNLELSVRMLDLTERQRAQRLPFLLNQIVDPDQSTVIFDNIEILFDKSLGVDPLRLLQQVARNRRVLVAWNGDTDLERLTYAEPDHPEYRKYEVSDVLIVSMNGRATIDTAA